MAFEQKTLLNFYKKLLAFYPMEFRERFGESMQQTFSDVCKEQKKISGKIPFSLMIWMFGETFFGIIKENSLHLKKGFTMENIISNQKMSAIFAVVLALPLAFILLIETQNIEPLNVYLRTMTTTADGYQLSAFGKIFFITAILLLPLGFFISLMPIARNMRSGRMLMANPVNFFISAGLFIFIAILVAVFVIDQYPCWMGVPNCD